MPKNVLAPPRSPKSTNAPSLAEQTVVSEGPAPKPLREKSDPNQHDFDVCVIGGGPGGYVAAIRAAQYGLKTACVEKEFLGGTCLNWGCIPSKVMIAAIERLEHVRHADAMGVQLPGPPTFDFAKMMARKEKVVEAQRSGIGMLFKKNGIETIEGIASFLTPNTVEVVSGKERRKVSARNFIVATGSSVAKIPIPGLEGPNVWTSDDAVIATEAPKRMLILGGGAVGVEFAYVFSGAGTEVTVVEMMPNLVPTMDEDLGVELARLFKRRKIAVHLGSTLEKAHKGKNGWVCAIKTAEGRVEVEADVVLLGVGRKANTDKLNLERVGVKLHRRGIEVVNKKMQTHAPHIYAIGDVIGNIQLAHVASAEGLVVAANCAGQEMEMDYNAYPDVVYTIPELAATGLSEKGAREAGRDVVVGKFPYRPFGRSMAALEQEGFVKIVADREFGEVLGMHIIGAQASSLIHTGVAAIRLEATLDDMATIIFAHPSFGEVIGEAVHDALGHAIHKL